jgi:LPXTG-site transpeptidase (sortase) family protein
MSDKKSPILGCLPKAIFENLGIGVLALIVGAIAGGPKMTIDQQNAQITFFVLLAIYLFITIWAIVSLVPKRKENQLQTQGIYKFVRHPMYGAIIFILNPALGILLRSWLLIISCFISYFIWRSAIGDEEKQLEEQFGDQYSKYRKTTWPFFPNLFKFNKPVFFGLTAVAVFIVSFVALNFPSFYLRSVQWDRNTSTEVSVKKPNAQSGSSALPFQQPKIKYNKSNSIVIEKLNIDAPLVFASGTTQKELNSALNNGVLIYPGSKLPGETGELFLSGHSSNYPWNKTQYGQVFTLLDRLQPGDIVTVYFNQYKYEYRVTRQSVVKPADAALNAQTSIKTITLMTCWPIGTAWKRLVVEGVIME